MDYFDQIFRASNTCWDDILGNIQQSITSLSNEDLLKQVQEEEVKHALFQMNPDKEPGPDGMTPVFFQKYWSIVGGDLVRIVRDFLEKGQLLHGINITNIVLVPRRKIHQTRVI